MFWITWAAIGLVALIVSGATILTRFDDVLGGIIGTLAWAAWAYGSTSIVTQTTCCRFVYQETGAALMGAGFAVVMLLITLRGTAEFLAPERITGDGPLDDDSR